MVSRDKIILMCLLLSISALLRAEMKDSVSVKRLQAVEVIAPTWSPNAASTPVQLVDRAQMERLGMQSVSDVIKRMSGVTVKDYGGIGGLKSVSIRNLGSHHTAVCYDGVAVGDAQSGQVDIGRFVLENLSSVSLSIGQSDDILQPARNAASAGVVYLQTMRPEFSKRNYGIECGVKVASFGLFNPALYYKQKLSKYFSCSLYGDYVSASGDYPFRLENGNSPVIEKRINSDVQSGRGELNVYGDFGRGGDLSVKGYYFASQRGLPGPVVLYNIVSTDRLWDKNGSAQLRYENSFDSRFSILLNGKYNYTYNRYLNGNGYDDRYSQWEGYGSATAKYDLWRTFSLALSSDVVSNYLETNLPSNVFPHRYTSLSSLTAQYKNGQVTATGSLLYTFVTEQVVTGSAPDDRSRWSPSLSVSVLPWSEYRFKIRAFYKEIFRIPTFSDLYYPRVGNRKLNPETTRQFNLGVSWWGEGSGMWKDFAFTCDGYYNRVHDKIVALPRLFIWSMMNMGEVEMAGCDVTLSTALQIAPRYRFLLSGNYSFQYAVDITNSDSKTYRHQIPYAPRHSGSASLFFENRWADVSYSLSFAGRRYSLPDNMNEDNQIALYGEHSISLSRRFNLKPCAIRLQADAINLGGKNYEIIQWYPMAGRSFMFKLSVII